MYHNQKQNNIMTKLSLIELVEKMLFFSNLGMNKEYNEVRNILKSSYLDKMVFSTIRYIKGEYTEREEKIYLELHKGL